MAVNEITLDATPEQVFDVLRDPFAYGHWVVGTREVRRVDDGFPAPGTRFHHSVGIGPLTIDDHTEVLEYRPDEHLVLKAKTRPLATAKVTLEVRRIAAGKTRVVMDERPGDLISRMLYNPVIDVLMKGRNTEALRRLGNLVSERKHRTA